jgi:mannosyltransferase
MTLAAIAIAGAAIRLHRLGHFSYGLDEILQTYWIHGPWRFFWSSLRFDAYHPPLDYLVGKLLETLDPADAVRKLPAVVWGVGTLVALAALLRRRAGSAAGLTAACLLAFSPFHVRYSQELRPYSLSLFLLCLSLAALDRFLERPGPGRLALLFLACLGTAYTLYTAALVLGIAALGLLCEDAVAPDAGRRRAARRFLAWSPAFVLALWIAYLPWWPVLLAAARRAPAAARAPLTWTRAGRVLSYFAFAPDDGYPLGWAGLFFLALAAIGAAVAVRRRGLRFLLAWGAGGFLAIEILGQIHPHYDFSRRFLPAGLALPALAAVALAALVSWRVTRMIGGIALASVLLLDATSLRTYFRGGRADWRPLADYLRREAAPRERVFTENQYSQLCVAFYLVGPQWLYEATGGGHPSRSVVNLDGQIRRLGWAWPPGQRAWLVLAGEPVHPALREWAADFPTLSFPRAERSVLHRLDPSLREGALARTQ